MKKINRICQASIDIGSSKICCWIGSPREDRWEVLGGIHYASQGVRGGHITDITTLETALLNVLYEAEAQAKTQARRALVTLNGGFFSYDYLSITLPLEKGIVTSEDLELLWGQITRPGFHAVHIIPLTFQVDHQEKISQPRGIVGKILKGLFHVVWIDQGSLETLGACFKRCQLHVSNIVLSAYGAALACLSEDEQELGATLVDMGARSTSLAFFSEGKMIGSSFLPIGGDHITWDVARGCETQISHAERLKILYGAALTTSHDYYETISLVPMGGQDETPSTHVPKSFLMNIIQARCEEIFFALKESLDKVAPQVASQRIVLTGGASQLPGLQELSQRILERPVRISKPNILLNAPDLSGAFSAVSGTFLYKNISEKKMLSYLSKWSLLISWLKKKL